MKEKEEEARKWQKANFKRYEWYAAKRKLAEAFVFLVFFTLCMTFAFIALWI